MSIQCISKTNNITEQIILMNGKLIINPIMPNALTIIPTTRLGTELNVVGRICFFTDFISFRSS